MIEKQQILVRIVETLEHDLNNAINSAEVARLDAIDDQSVAETQYDTLGIEASYLAHGQSKRAENLKAQIKQYQRLELKKYGQDDEIGLGCLLTIGSSEQQNIYFIGPCAGGLKIDLEGQKILIITPQAPLAATLIGKYHDDNLELGKFIHLNNNQQPKILTIC